ncbi:hypothetical protein ACHAQA_002591 [Verticillium albo-atrum]
MALATPSTLIRSRMSAIINAFSIRKLSLRPLVNLKTLVFILALLNFKSLHLMWFTRFLCTFTRRLTDSAPYKHLSPRCLFLPALSATRSPALECDYNLHKSNSTYFTDLDMSRGNFCLIFFSKKFSPVPGPNHFTLVLGGATCTWRKEIKPYQSYELWTRILSWDEKWLYVVTHFVKAGVFKPEEYVMQPQRKGAKRSATKSKEDVDVLKTVYASSVSRYVFKNNRRTIPPAEALKDINLLPVDEAQSAEVEDARVKGLPVGKLEAGWDAVHGSFQPGTTALGWYNSVY